MMMMMGDCDGNGDGRVGLSPLSLPLLSRPSPHLKNLNLRNLSWMPKKSEHTHYKRKKFWIKSGWEETEEIWVMTIITVLGNNSFLIFVKKRGSDVEGEAPQGPHLLAGPKDPCVTIIIWWWRWWWWVVMMVKMVMTMIIIMTSSQMCLEFWMVRSLTSMHDQSLNSHHCYHDHHLYS